MPQSCSSEMFVELTFLIGLLDRAANSRLRPSASNRFCFFKRHLLVFGIFVLLF